MGRRDIFNVGICVITSKPLPNQSPGRERVRVGGRFELLEVRIRMDADLARSLVRKQTMDLRPSTPEHLHALEEGVVLSLRPPFAFLLGFLRANVADAAVTAAAGVFNVSHALLEARLRTDSHGAHAGQNAADAAVATGRGSCIGAAAADVCGGGWRNRSGRRRGGRTRMGYCH